MFSLGMKRLIILIWFIPILGSSQENIGMPAIINFNKKTYNAGTQNWKIALGTDGVAYFANNEGLLCFDGTFWKLFPLPRKTILRSLCLSKDRVYVGGQNELGYFSPDSIGKLRFTDLKPLLPELYRDFNDVWDIEGFGDQIFFRMRQKIFRLDGERMQILESASWQYLGTANGKLYAQDQQKGLLVNNGNGFSPFLQNDPFLHNTTITGIASAGADSLLISTKNQGLYFVYRSKAVHLNINRKVAQMFSKGISCIANMRNGQFAIGTPNDGIFVIDYQGKIKDHYSTRKGLQNSGVLCLNQDAAGNLWAGLENGIDYIAHNEAIRKIEPELENSGAGYAAIVFDNQLFLGTNHGLFKTGKIEVSNLAEVKQPFEKVEGLDGQVWNLSEINKTLLIGHHEGAFMYKGNNIYQVSKGVGVWNFNTLSPVQPALSMVCGTYRGLKLVESYPDLPWYAIKSSTDFESSRFVEIYDNRIWVGQPYKGIFRINFLKDSLGNAEKMDSAFGISTTSNNYVFQIKNRLVVTTNEGLLEYHIEKKSFLPSPWLDSLLPFKNIRFLKEDPYGNVWLIYDKTLVIADFSGSSVQYVELAPFTNNLLSGFESIYFYNQNNIILGKEQGFFLLNYPKYKTAGILTLPLLRTVKLIGKDEVIVFEGFGNPAKLPVNKIAPLWKDIHFDYSAPAYGYQEFMWYSVKLEGYESHWSAWTKRTDKEYTKLPPGTYTFYIRCKNYLGQISESNGYSFEVLPPWYQTKFAYLLYFISFSSLIFLAIKFQQAALKAAQKKYEEEQVRLKYLQQLEMEKAEKELVKVRNEKLEAELELQNAELASATMHLLQKAEIITEIKEEMMKLTKNFKNEISMTELKKMIKTLGEDETLETGWDQFAQHFDKVHSNFLANLKFKFPNLTPNEMKLCAYLRMNLSSKEISQLMHITPKSVELSRYRLRKKLNLKHEDSLYNFLMSETGNGHTNK